LFISQYSDVIKYIGRQVRCITSAVEEAEGYQVR